jgi:ubiquinone/menaquinone biosynthesis C-methylase UbiE
LDQFDTYDVLRRIELHSKLKMSPNYSPEPTDARQFTSQYDAFYTRFAAVYDRLVKSFPLWRRWLDNALPCLQGPKVLEVSFGTGYLLTRYAGLYESYALDLNLGLARIARSNLLRSDLTAHLQVANVEHLPYSAAAFDSVLNTMAFTAYPDGERALTEITRVLKPGGRLVMLDISYPNNGNRIGTLLTNGWKASGDIIRDLQGMLGSFGYQFTDHEVGGFGSVHLYVATKSS